MGRLNKLLSSSIVHRPVVLGRSNRERMRARARERELTARGERERASAIDKDARLDLSSASPIVAKLALAG